MLSRILLSLLVATQPLFVALPAQAIHPSGLAIGLATDNLALGLAVGLALDSSSGSQGESRPTPEFLHLLQPLSDGTKKLAPPETASYLQALFLTEETKAGGSLGQLLVEKYGSAEEQRIILKSLIAANLLRGDLLRSDQFQFVERAIDEVSQVEKMSANLIDRAASHSIEIRASALSNVRDIQRGFGFYSAIEKLEQNRALDFSDVKADLVHWTAVEILDLQFDVTDKNTGGRAREDLANLVRVEIGVDVLASAAEVLGDDIRNPMKKMYEEYTSQRAYEGYIDTRSRRPLGSGAYASMAIVGMIAGVLTIPADMYFNGTLDALTFRVTKALGPNGSSFGDFMIEFGIFSGVFLTAVGAGTAAGAGVTYLLAKGINSVRSRLAARRLRAEFAGSRPMTRALQLQLGRTQAISSCRGLFK